MRRKPASPKLNFKTTGLWELNLPSTPNTKAPNNPNHVPSHPPGPGGALGTKVHGRAVLHGRHSMCRCPMPHQRTQQRVTADLHGNLAGNKCRDPPRRTPAHASTDNVAQFKGLAMHFQVHTGRTGNITNNCRSTSPLGTPPFLGEVPASIAQPTAANNHNQSKPNAVQPSVKNQQTKAQGPP